MKTYHELNLLDGIIHFVVNDQKVDIGNDRCYGDKSLNRRVVQEIQKQSRFSKYKIQGVDEGFTICGMDIDDARFLWCHLDKTFGHRPIVNK